MLLENYGYQFDGDNIEKYKNVSNENLPLVKKLEIGIMGIGWPVKAFLSCICVMLYTVIIYLFWCLITKLAYLIPHRR